MVRGKCVYPWAPDLWKATGSVSPLLTHAPSHLAPSLPSHPAILVYDITERSSFDALADWLALFKECAASPHARVVRPSCLPVATPRTPPPPSGTPHHRGGAFARTCVLMSVVRPRAVAP